MPGGRRESHWLVTRRCLAIIRRLQRGPATARELIQAACEAEGVDAYGGAQGIALRKKFEKDRERIRRHLLVDLRFDRGTGRYLIRDLWMPLLDLPDEDLDTIAWLAETFGPEAPRHDQVHGLIDRLRLYLAPERRAVIEQHRMAFTMDLRRRDEDEITDEVWDKLTRALVSRRRVEFEYLSPQQEDRTPRRHVVDPYECFFDTVRGHFYLRGWCHYTDGPRGRHIHRRYFRYRLGRIRNVRVLPDKLPPAPPVAPRYRVEYVLASHVARLGITRHHGIEIECVDRKDDGRVIVQGTTEDVFWTARTLLHYGPSCRVLGGPELLQEMQALVGKMWELYRGDPRASAGSSAR